MTRNEKQFVFWQNLGYQDSSSGTDYQDTGSGTGSDIEMDCIQ